MKLHLNSDRIGQSNTDYRRLSAEQLIRHIELLEAKRPHNWTQTFANLRASRGRLDGLIGAAFGHVHGGRLTRRGERLLMEVRSSDPFGGGPTGTALYYGVAENVTSQGISIRGENSHLAGSGRTYLSRDEILSIEAYR